MRRQVRLSALVLALGIAGVGRADETTPDAAPTAEPPPVPILLRRPGNHSRATPVIDIDPSQVPPPLPSDPRELVVVPDRWRIVESLGVKERLADPYSQNTLKGDRPIWPSRLGREWFVNVSAIPETVAELRHIPVPVAPQVATHPGQNGPFGNGRSETVVQQLLPSVSIIRGDTTFRPPDWEIRFAPALNLNATFAREVEVLTADPTAAPRQRVRTFAGVQEAFVDKHLRNASVRYDFDSLRAGIQPFNADFRGFVFQDAAAGVRLFGTRANNALQYNLAWFRRVEKDTNSGLNDVSEPLRDDDVFVANLFLQDLLAYGHTTQLVAIYNRNREKDDHYDRNGFRVRPALVGDGEPHGYDVVYLGWNGDGHFGRLNVTHAAYALVGRSTHDPFEGRPQDIAAGLVAVEPSVDFDWIRVRLSLLAASGDRDPYGGSQNGFDAIVENPQFAGSNTSFWIRQAVPFVGGAGVGLSSRNGVLPSLRSSGEEGQSNFVNPGLLLAGVGGDFNVTPQLRLVANASWLRFATTEVLQAIRNQERVGADIGADLSLAVQYRPLMSQNIVLGASGSTLLPGQGYRDLFPAGEGVDRPYSFLTSLLFRY
jgi:hypothetical protein